MLSEQNSSSEENETSLPSMWSLLSYYCGIFALLPIIGIVLGVLAVCFGTVALWEMKKTQNKAGLWICRIGFAVGLLAFVGQSFILYMLLFNP